MQEEEITPEKLLNAINELYANSQTYINTMAASPQSDAINKIMELIENCNKNK